MLVRTSLYKTILIVLAILLVAALASCAAGSKEKGRNGISEGTTVESAGNSTQPAPWKLNRTMRLLLAGADARDSAASITELYVDQAFRLAADSIPVLQYLTLNNRDSLAQRAIKSGKTGVDLAELGKALNLDGVIYARLARFSSVLALELRIIDPQTNKLLFRDLEFSLVRYRDSSGTLLLGPALFDLARKGLGRYAGEMHTQRLPIATEPVVVTNVVIDSSSLGRLFKNRESLGEGGVRALGEYARINYPELVTFDIQSRNQLYKTFNVGAVENYLPVNDLERRALFSIGIDRYVTASVIPVGEHRATVRVELRSILSPSRDSLVSSRDSVVSINSFETTTVEHDFIELLLSLAQPMFTAEADRVRNSYQQSLTGEHP